MYVCIYKNTHIHICLEFSMKKIHPASTPIKLIKKKRSFTPSGLYLARTPLPWNSSSTSFNFFVESTMTRRKKKEGKKKQNNIYISRMWFL